jgi:hypothetical protein
MHGSGELEEDESEKEDNIKVWKITFIPSCGVR